MKPGLFRVVPQYRSTSSRYLEQRRGRRRPNQREREDPNISLGQISFQDNEEKRILHKIPVTGRRLYTAGQCALAQTSRWGSAQLSSHHGGGIIFTSTPTLDTTLKSNGSQYTSSRESSTQYGNHVHWCLKGRDRLSSCHIIMVVVMRSSLWMLQWIMLVCEIYGDSDGQSWRFFWFEPFT